MTLANSNSPASARAHTRRSWLALMRKPSAPPIPGTEVPEDHKPPADIADLLLMNALDTNAPAETPGTVDLLASMVQDHLDRDAPQLPQQPEDATDALAILTPSPDAPDPASTPEMLDPELLDEDPIHKTTKIAPSLSHDERTKLLQREIETLLRDEPTSAPPAADTLTPAPEFDTTTPPAHLPKDDIAFSNLPPAALGSAETQISQDELRTLLPLESAEISPSFSGVNSTQSITGEAAFPGGYETDRRISDAEQVLTEELNQLIAQRPMEEPVTQGTSALDVPAKNAADNVPVVTAQIPATEAQSPASVTPITTAAATRENVAAETSQAAAVQNKGHEPASEFVSERETAKGVTAAPTGDSNKLVKLIQGMVLMVAQILDMPFSWISELDKNIIGFAAFLLLASGGVLYVMSLIYR